VQAPNAPTPTKPRRQRLIVAAALLLIAVSLSGSADIAQHFAQLPPLSWLGLCVAAVLLLRG
jgi:hypothetical protein